MFSRTLFRSKTLFFAGLLTTLAPGCGAPVDADVTEEAATEADGKADSLATTSDYYKTSVLTPLCMPGGPCPGPKYFVSLVNKDKTRCADGKSSVTCSVKTINFDKLGIDEDAQIRLMSRIGSNVNSVVLRGSLKAKRVNGSTVGELVVSEAWEGISHGTIGDGTFYRVTDNGRRCVTGPCASFHEVELNSTRSQEISALHLDAVNGADDERINDVYTAVDEGGALLVGKNVTKQGSTMRGAPFTSTELVPTQAYTRVQKSASKCIRTGCSGQVCSDHSVITTCDFRPEYACYQQAKCEVQADGKCGFTRDAALTACLGRN